MISFFGRKKTKIQSSEIKAFNTALIALNNFIELKEFIKAKAWIHEIKEKEKKSFDERVISLSWREKDKELKKYSEKIKKLEKLEIKLWRDQIKYENELEEKKFKIREKRFKEEIGLLIQKKDHINATYLVWEYLRKYNDNNKVVAYCNKQRKIISKLVEKEKNKKEKEIKKDAFKEAKNLMWDILNIKEAQNKNKIVKDLSLKDQIKRKFSFYNNLKQKVKNKKMLDEVSLLISEEKYWSDILAKKLSNIHSWLSKELSWVTIPGYDFYWKILWADKISGDTFGLKNTKDSTKFFIWDATGHWIKAWFMVSLLTQQFENLADKWNLQENVMEINNNLKQDLKSGNFITSIFFETKKEAPEKLNFVWMGHEPMFHYKFKNKKSEKLIPWGLAAWIRINKNIDSIRKKTIDMWNNDVIITFSDWIIEAKSPNWEMYGFERLEKKFTSLLNIKSNLKEIYNELVNDVINFSWGSKFNDDLTIILIRRNQNKDLLVTDGELESVAKEIWISKKDVRKFKWKSKDKIKEEIENIKKKNELKIIVWNLKTLYLTWEILKLKQESIRYIKEGFIHEKINFYLKKALDKEQEYKIQQKNEKITNKYNVLKSLYEKGDFETVAKECAEIIAKDGNL